jgi:hypothetical protein
MPVTRTTTYGVEMFDFQQDGERRQEGEERQVKDRILAVFGPDGTRRGVLEGAVDENELRMALDDVFSLKR